MLRRRLRRRRRRRRRRAVLKRNRKRTVLMRSCRRRSLMIRRRRRSNSSSCIHYKPKRICSTQSLHSRHVKIITACCWWRWGLRLKSPLLTTHFTFLHISLFFFISYFSLLFSIFFFNYLTIKRKTEKDLVSLLTTKENGYFAGKNYIGAGLTGSTAPMNGGGVRKRVKEVEEEGRKFVVVMLW